MIAVSITPVSVFTNIQIRIIRIYRASQSANHRLIHYAFRILVFANVKFPIILIIGNLSNAWRHWAGNERFWGYFWGYSVIDRTTIPIKINRLRHLFDCLLCNPYCKACWRWYVQQHSACNWCNNRQQSRRQVD